MNKELERKQILEKIETLREKVRVTNTEIWELEQRAEELCPHKYTQITIGIMREPKCNPIEVRTKVCKNCGKHLATQYGNNSWVEWRENA